MGIGLVIKKQQKGTNVKWEGTFAKEKGNTVRKWKMVSVS